MAPVACDARLVPAGEGRVVDWWLANAWMRVVLRHPTNALSVPGVGGLTLVDAAPWGADDAVYEIVPLVGGGWLDIDDVEVLPDGVRAAGVVRALPARPARDEGAPAEVTWRIDPDGPFVTAEGAEGFSVHGLPGVEVLDGQLVSASVIAHGGEFDDLGGALWVTGTDTLTVAAATEAWGWLGPVIAVSGTAPDAEEITAYADGVAIARVPITADPFTIQVPANTDRVRAEAAGRAPSPGAAPGSGLALEVGPPGRAVVTLSWPDGVARGARLGWSTSGRTGAVYVDPAGSLVSLGAGRYDVTLSAGPEWEPSRHVLDVPAEGTVALTSTLTPRFDPGPRVLAAVRWPGQRSRTWRGSDARALRTAASTGYAFAVVTPEDDVASGTSTVGGVVRRNGVVLTHPEGWTVSAWTWAATSRGGHGAIPMGQLTPADALAAARGGPGTDRFTAVDLPWLDGAGPPFTVDPQPDFVYLTDAADWAPWYAWLDAGVDVVPVGPATWVDVLDPTRVAGAEVEQGLVRGHVCAGTGGLVTLTVGGVPSGELAPDGGAVIVTVRSADPPVDRVAIVTTGGAVLAEVHVDGNADLALDLPLDGSWVVARAMSDDGAAWAVTGPVWLGATRPGGR